MAFSFFAALVDPIFAPLLQLKPHIALFIFASMLTTIIYGINKLMINKKVAKEIKDKLGFDAYPGTLNLKVNKKQFDSLKNINPIKIDGLKKNNKTFGGASCYMAKIKNINGSIIIPDLTKHKYIVEFISHMHLKSELKLKDGDKVKIEIND